MIARGFVPGAGVEPAQPLRPLVFETSASTDSAIRANWQRFVFQNGRQSYANFFILQKWEDSTKDWFLRQ